MDFLGFCLSELLRFNRLEAAPVMFSSLFDFTGAGEDVDLDLYFCFILPSGPMGQSNAAYSRKMVIRKSLTN